jgi:hypothetical protein
MDIQQIENKAKSTASWRDEVSELFKGKHLTLDEIKASIGKGLAEKHKRINDESKRARS